MNTVAASVARQALSHTSKMQPLGKKKSRLLAFILAFLFGCVGVAAYVSIADALLVLAVLVVISLATGGIAFPLAWLFGAIFAALRVHRSNQALERQGAATPAPPLMPPERDDEELFEIESKSESIAARRAPSEHV